MKQYLELLKDVNKNGTIKSDRTGTGTKSVFGRQIRFNLNEGFPLITTKKMFINGIIHELLWFLNGDSNIEYLVKNNVHIWDSWPYKSYLKQNNINIPDNNSIEWKSGLKEFVNKIKTDKNFAVKYGELGPVYGRQWRHWQDDRGNDIDQIQNIINTIKDNPNSRRIIVSAWNVADIDEMAISGLPPCHTLFQFYIVNNKLNCQLYQRSADVFLGVPFNIASYDLLTMMIAQVTNLELGEFIHTFGDAHIYLNHSEQVEIQLSRTPLKLPKMIINKDIKSIFDFKIEDFKLEDYKSYDSIKAPIAI